MFKGVGTPVLILLFSHYIILSIVSIATKLHPLLELSPLRHDVFHRPYDAALRVRRHAARKASFKQLLETALPASSAVIGTLARAMSASAVTVVVAFSCWRLAIGADVGTPRDSGRAATWRECGRGARLDGRRRCLWGGWRGL